MTPQEDSVFSQLIQRGVSRRDFMKFCGAMAGALAMPKPVSRVIAKALQAKKRTPVIWLELQDCAGCTESFLRSANPTAADIVLDVLSVDYHETIMAAAGKQAEEAKHATIKAGGYLLVVEGSISLGDNGVYCTIAGKSSEFLLREAAANAVAIVAVGNCAAFGGIPKAAPNPTKAVGVMDLIKDKPVLNLPGCPYNTDNLTATVVHFLTFGALPDMDKLNRPLFAFGALIHDNCERRGHFDKGEFVSSWGDQGHINGWCLYRMGCKGPITYNNCPQIRFNGGISWPIGAGHPCVGCAEPDFWERPFYVPIKLDDFTPPATYAPVEAPTPAIPTTNAVVTGAVLGVAAGVLGKVAYDQTRKGGTGKKAAAEPQAEETKHE